MKMSTIKPVLKYSIVLLLTIVLATYLVIGQKKPREFVVEFTSAGFNPSLLAVVKGDKVLFKNLSDQDFWPASDPHPLHSEYSVFDPRKPIPPGETWVFKTTKIGDWDYHDHLFPSYRGRLVVVSKKDWDLKNKKLTREEITNMVKSDPKKTYEMLKNIYDPSTSVAHSVFHLFGEVLYDKFGESAIENCDSFAGFGCFHGFFIRAVGQKGVDIAIDLDKRCVDKFGPTGLGCPHGIGHGLVEYFGLGKITESLTICEKLSWKGPLFGCAGGVFMENNFPTIFDKDGDSKVVTREAHGNLFEPCLTKAGDFKAACYYEQASWWNEVLDGNYVQIGKYCSSLKNLVEYESCLLGAGNSVAETTHYNASKVIESCASVGTLKSVAICRAGGAWAFFANPAVRNQSESLCVGLGEFEDLCLEKRILVK